MIIYFSPSHSNYQLFNCSPLNLHAHNATKRIVTSHQSKAYLSHHTLVITSQELSRLSSTLCALSPHSAAAACSVANYFSLVGDVASSLEALRGRDDAVSLLVAGHILTEEGRIDEAKVMYERAIAKDRKLYQA